MLAQSPDSTSLWIVVLAGAVVVLAALAAYHNSFSGPFIFDDQDSISKNISIRHFDTVFFPPNGSGITVSGRPVLNASFALNYAIAGNNPVGFHIGNVLIHVLAALTLLAVTRRTLRSPLFEGKFSKHGTLLACSISVLWAVHPLQTESVTYTVQRAESLVGLFYLLTLYGFIRYVAHRSWYWFLFTSSVCLLGMGVKEVMATVPLVVFLYDRTFASGSFRTAWQRHGRLHLCLAGTLVLLAVLVVSGRGRGGSIGATGTVTWWGYVCTQAVATVRYLWLTVWPARLTLDYGMLIEKNYVLIVPCALTVVVALAATTLAVIRKPQLGFLGAWFFVILAPSSSVIPVVTQTMAEHRMYLSLAAVIGLGVLGLYAWIGRSSLFVFSAVAVGLGWLTIQRNEDYRSELAIWTDTVAKCPNNERAHTNRGLVLGSIPGRQPEAIAHYETALRINPNYMEAQNNLANALASIPGRLPEAIALLERVLRINPNLAAAHNNLGSALEKIPDRLPEAITHYETALRINPDYAEAHNNMGNALASLPGRLSDAIFHYEAALEINPELAEAHNNLGLAFAKIPGRAAEAISQYEAALRINPSYAKAHNNFGLILVRIPARMHEAIAHYETALLINPDDAEAHNNLAMALASLPGRLPEAIAHYEAALRIDPNLAEVHNNLGAALENLPGRTPDAIIHYEAALRIDPDFAGAHINLGLALAEIPNRSTEAIAHYETALRINPNYAEAHYILGNTLLGSPDKLSDAIMHFEAAVRIKPDYAEAYNSLGIALTRIPNHMADAIVQFEAALRLRPDFAMARENLATAKRLLARQP